jgi:hypothetical protein
MQRKQAQQLRKAYKEKYGNKLCSHPSLEKLYDLGIQDIDMVCTVCFEEFSPEELKKLREKRLRSEQ